MKMRLEIMGSAPLQVLFWLAINNRCRNSHHLAKRGLPHPSACPLCDKEDETIQHILVSCVFSQDRFGCLSSENWGWLPLLLNLLPLVFLAGAMVRSEVFLRISTKRNSLITLVSWEIWKHRNTCVFEGVRPCISVVLQAVANDSSLWSLAGASALH
jgi:hypothetical protein